jgi:hypothetical protein
MAASSGGEIGPAAMRDSPGNGGGAQSPAEIWTRTSNPSTCAAAGLNALPKIDAPTQLP